MAASSCCTPREIVRTETNYDTIVVNKIEKVQVPIHSTITIEEPCDSLGILKDFKQTIKTGKAKITVSNVNGTIDVQVDMDSIKEVWKSEQSKSQKETIIEIPVEVPKPFLPKIFWYSIGVNVLLLIYALRKFIPFLKFIP